MNNIRRNVLVILFVILILSVIYLINLTIELRNNQCLTNDNDIVINDNELNNEVNNEVDKLKVDIKGAVVNPNVYEVDKSSTVLDVINIAGGLRLDADTSVINLSKQVKNEMVIYIYTKDEVKNSNIVDTVVKVIDNKCVCPNIQNDGCINTEINGTISNGNNLININTADVKELTSIAGIGEAKAKAIIKYREEKGEFSSIDDVKNVEGIGDTLFESIKIYITT